MYTVFTMTPLLHVYCVQGSCWMWICCPSIYTVFSVHHDLSLCRCTNEGVWGCCWRGCPSVACTQFSPWPLSLSAGVRKGERALLEMLSLHVHNFHHDLSPSLQVSVREGRGHCWRCCPYMYTMFTMTSLSLCRCPQGGDEGAAGDAVPPPPDPGGAPGGPLLRQWDQLQVGEVVVTHVYFLLKASPEISACFKVYLWILMTYTMFFKRNS